jgi:hypothetical protein
MNTLDYAFILLLGISLVTAVSSFAVIEKYLLAHRLVNPKASHPDVLDFYKKYIAHTRNQSGRIGWPFLIHASAAATFMLGGAVYAILRLAPWVLSRF